MDPCTHREVTTKLAKITGGRCYSVRYRLAPQEPFPAALLDAFVSYLTLLSPPEGSLHTPVPANKIVFAGDSAGGGLALALIQTILTLKRSTPQPKIRFHGRDVPIDVPAGATLCSPFCDLTRTLPSSTNNAPFDYLPSPHQDPSKPYEPYPFPEDTIWPTSPPRVDFYVDASASIHPLVSPVAGPVELWKDAPPIFLHVGQECLEDDGVFLARKIHEAGSTVILERYDGKPHCFGLVFFWDPAAKRCFRAWAEFCVDAVRQRVERKDHATLISCDASEEEEVDFEKLRDISDEEMQKILKRGRDWRVAGEMELLRKWEEARSKSKL